MVKFLVVFVHIEDVPDASAALRRHRFRFTMLHSTSGYLQEESRTFLVGLPAERLNECLEIFKEKCESRLVGAPGSLLEGQPVPQEGVPESIRPVAVEIGGAVGFVIEAERVL